MAAPSFAQSTTQSSSQSTTTQTGQTTEVQEVVVTGTRIRNPQFTSASPLQVITSEQTELRGVPDLAGALQSSSLAASSAQTNDQLTGYVTGGGGGVQTLSLRGLGSQRTLTLMNGRRAGPAGTRGQVQAFDLNVIPQSQVERIDILKDGASSTYGSDAVAGVVNIITSQKLDGGSFNAYASQPFEGGGEQYRLDGSFGRVFDRGYFNIGAEYYRALVLRRSDRDDTACAEDYLFSPTTGQRIDYIDSRTGDYKCYNQNTNYVQLASGAFSGQNLVRTMPGVTYPTAAQGNNSPYAGWARFNRAGYPDTYQYTPSENPNWSKSSVISPQERATINFTGGYELNGSAEVYTELLYNRRESEQYGAAQIFPSFAQRNIVNGAGNFLPASNPNNPFGVNVVPVISYESNSGQTVDYYRGVVGIRGSFGAMGRNWDYDVYGQYSLSDAVYDNGPRLYLDRFLATMSPNVACTNTPAGGNFSNFNCSALPNGVPWTSERVLSGNFNQAERDFLFINEESTTTYDHAYIEGLLSTDNLFSVPAGSVGAAFGFQVRHEKIDDTPAEQARNRNIALFTSAGRTTGSDNIREVFAEFDVPLLKDLPFAESLNLNVSGRLSDYDSYGTSTTYKVAMNYQVTPEYRLRGSYGTSFRAPSLYEQFLGSQIGYGSQASSDPCYDYVNAGVEANVAAACAALGIPGNYTAVGGSSVPIASVGGAGRLEAETAETQNYGIVWTPSFAQLSVAVDYFDIKIENSVGQFGAYNIIQECLRGNTDFCSLYTRDPANFYVTSVNNSYVNISEQTNRGIDLALRYRRSFPFGDLSIDSQHTWKLEDKTNALGGIVTDYLGDTFNYNGPAYSGNIYFNLTRGDVTWFYGIDAIGRGSDIEEAGGQVFANSKYANLPAGISSANCADANSYCAFYKYYTEFTTIHSASVRYRVNDWTFQIGVNNLYDERPPAVNVGEFRVGTAALNGYDMRGRRGFIRFGRKF
ncbi:MAG: TonB-dependent receptor domain-containing protein [Brevundimonas sp.]|uniref:TonB-dependent receptor domain-containing protein n=1 Tax=Brevundimonas sp. TaxID=1871086 RepID=UPI0028D5C276|nr:TonB-dependent receptor [uncultured Brevundimonas sp.]